MNDIKRLIHIAVFSFIVILFNIIVFPISEINNSLNGLIVLDLRWSYDLNDVLTLFETIGTEGRLHYMYFLIADTIYMYCYFMLVWHLIIFIHKNIGKLGEITSFLRFSAFPAVLFDMLENGNTLILLLNFPDITQQMAARGSIFSMVKWYCISGFVLIIVCYIFYMVLRQLMWFLKNKTNNDI